MANTSYLQRSTSILGALHRHRTGLNIRELGELTGFDHTTLHKELHEMIARRQVEREQIAVPRAAGKTGLYRFKLTPEFGKLVVDLG